MQIFTEKKTSIYFFVSRENVKVQCFITSQYYFGDIWELFKTGREIGNLC